jgi:NTP pyrophosphatase (non-canonical NTP hydrolase)
MPQNDLDELSWRIRHTFDSVARIAIYLQIFDTIIHCARTGDNEGARLGWSALPRWEELSEAERREIEPLLIRKFEELSAAYAAAPSPPGERWKVGSPVVDIRRVIKLCESVTDAFGNYTAGTGLAAKQLAAVVPTLIERIEALNTALAELHDRTGRAGLMDERLLREQRDEIARLRADLAVSTRAETQVSISQWAEKTFGPAGSNARAVARANREMAELLEHVTADDAHPEAAEEVADIVIVLYRVATRLGVDLHERIDAKMARNRVRKWKLDGTGHGYHVKADPPSHPMIEAWAQSSVEFFDRKKAEIDQMKVTIDSMRDQNEALAKELAELRQRHDGVK